MVEHKPVQRASETKVARQPAPVAAKPRAVVAKPGPAVSKPGPVANKPEPTVSKPASAATDHEPVQHISQEEAVAHIQALLDAKRERDRQAPTWPTGDAGHGTTSSPSSGDNGQASTAPSPEATHASTAHERGDQQKSKD
ncbi:hypothetical protein [Luteibacter sp. 9135]|uniref:hypothetical protein n=1 Tax=Luteibacter sp. 9135 TaxID=1500893 RepID=UPI00056CB29D|nr:hypothetical protein [Luteibacter sp. 9135]